MKRSSTALCVVAMQMSLSYNLSNIFIALCVYKCAVSLPLLSYFSLGLCARSLSCLFHERACGSLFESIALSDNCHQLISANCRVTRPSSRWPPSLSSSSYVSGVRQVVKIAHHCLYSCNCLFVGDTYLFVFVLLLLVLAYCDHHTHTCVAREPHHTHTRCEKSK